MNCESFIREMLGSRGLEPHQLVRNSQYCRHRHLSGVALPPGYRGRRHFTIEVAGPIRSRAELFILAHEVGHVGLHFPWTSKKEYLKEYEAELFALDEMRRLSLYGPDLLRKAKLHIRHHCEWREQRMGPGLDWNLSVTRWCGFEPDTPGRIHDEEPPTP